MSPQLWSWILAAVGIFGIYLAGRKNAKGWLVGIFAQILWLIYAISTEQWGFMFTAFAYGTIYAINWTAWRQKERQNRERETSDAS